MNKFNFNKLTPFKWFILENFPFIEADFDALTEWQLFCKIGKEINKIINSQNTVGNEMEILSQAFIDLQNYVNNYFDNLDVQDEINNKLNEMAESGELQNIIGEFLRINSQLIFNSVSDMKSSNNLIVGSTAKTLGFYNINDGGNAIYKIVDDSSLNVDNMFVHLLDNGLKAQLLIENNTINILQLGARKQDKQNNKYDIKPYIERYLLYLDNFDFMIKLYIPAGLYNTSPIEIVRPKGFFIYGDKGLFNGYPTKTTITAISNQTHVIKIGNYERPTTSAYISGITISSGNFIYDESVKNFVCNSAHEIENKAFIIKNCSFINSDLLNFEYIDGYAMSVDTSWELFFDVLNFENIECFNKSCLLFDTTNQDIPYSNISDSVFNHLRFEKLTGDCIKFNSNNLASGLKIGTINVEPSRCDISNYDYQFINGDNDIERYFAVINCTGSCDFIVDDIQLSNVLYKYFIVNNKKYSLGSVINSSADNCLISCGIGCITIGNSNLGVNIINNIGFYNHLRTNVIIDKVINRTIYSAICNVNEFGNIKINSSINKFSVSESVLSNFKSFINNLKRDSLQERGIINFDKDSISKLVIKNNNEFTSTGKNFIEYILSNEKLQIIAKIPNGETLQVRVQSTDGTFTTIATASLVGTGNYKLYELPYNNMDYLGKIVTFGIVTNNDSVIGAFDVFNG